MSEKKIILLPADDAVQNWFEENVDKACSSSSAIYKFRLWLESFQQPQPGARWVKAAEFKYEEGVTYHAKDSKSKGAGRFNSIGAFIWGDCTVTYPRDQNDLFILDESGAEPAKESDTIPAEEMFAFVNWIKGCYQPDEDGTWICASGEQYTTEQIYQQFKNATPKA